MLNLVKLDQSGQKSLRSLGLVKNHEKSCYVRILTSFDLWSNPRLTRGILVILARKCTLGALVSKQVMPHHSGFSRDPMERK